MKEKIFVFALFSLLLGLAAPSVGAAPNTGSGKPTLSEKQCESLWSRVWNLYRDYQDAAFLCGRGYKKYCAQADMFYRMYERAEGRYDRARCDNYNLAAVPGDIGVVSDRPIVLNP